MTRASVGCGSGGGGGGGAVVVGAGVPVRGFAARVGRGLRGGGGLGAALAQRAAGRAMKLWVVHMRPSGVITTPTPT